MAPRNNMEKAMAYEVHVRLRTANKLYQCRYGCLPAYRDVSRLNKHMVRNHNWERVYPKQKPGQRVSSNVVDWEPKWKAWSSTLHASQNVSHRSKSKRKPKNSTSSLANSRERKRGKPNLQPVFSLDPSIPRDDVKIMAEELARKILKEEEEHLQQLRDQPLICRIFPPTLVSGMTGFGKEYLEYMEEKLVTGSLFTWQEFKDGLEAVCREEDADNREKVKKEAISLSFLFLRNDIRKDFRLMLKEILRNISLFVQEWQYHQTLEAKTAKNKEILERRRADFVKGCLLQYDALQGLTYADSTSTTITAITALSPLDFIMKILNSSAEDSKSKRTINIVKREREACMCANDEMIRIVNGLPSSSSQREKRYRLRQSKGGDDLAQEEGCSDGKEKV